MKKLFLLGCIAILSIIMAAPGQAEASLVFGSTSGSGSAGTAGTTYSYAGNLSFDNTIHYTTPVGQQTLSEIMGQSSPTQYRVAIDSSGMAVNDVDYGNPPGYPAGHTPTIAGVGGSYQWALNNNTGIGPGATLYGSVVSWNFAPAEGGTAAYGTVNGTLKSTDGSIHWYYGSDADTGGKTALSSFGLSDTFNFTGNYTITGGENSSNITYNLTGTVAANPVPIPGAVWLLGSGLMGLVGLRRRFTK
jgi:hypothetical protein